MIPNGKNSENNPKGNQMTTLTAANYDLVTDRLARIMLDESATTPEVDAELIAVFADLPDERRQSVLQMGRIFQAGGALADELHALCDRGDFRAVNLWLAARVK